MVKRKGDLVSLIIIFVLVVVFVPLIVKYLCGIFGPVVSGFQDMVMPTGNAEMMNAGGGYTNSLVMPCRSPNPSTGEVCPEGTFCGNASKTCIDRRYRGGNGNVTGYTS